VNYFGRSNSVEKLEIAPILFMKNETKIALYGIGYMKDDRFNLVFEHKKVKFRRPEGKDWFNILVIHQTKERPSITGSAKCNFVKESIFPDFIDLILWGHEHECISIAKKCEVTGTHILYMGSTTITSLIDAEAKPKHCFLLTVDKTMFDILPIPLERARPFVYDQIELSKCGLKKIDDKSIEDCIANKVCGMIQSVKKRMLPLIRLKVEYTGFHVVTMRKLEKKMEGKMANCGKDFVKFYKRPSNSEKPIIIDEIELSIRDIEDPEKAELNLVVLY